MKKLMTLILLMLTGCTKYTALSCNRDGCVELTSFKEEYECDDFVRSIIFLHTELRQDKPNRKMLCQER